MARDSTKKQLSRRSDGISGMIFRGGRYNMGTTTLGKMRYSTQSIGPMTAIACSKSEPWTNLRWMVGSSRFQNLTRCSCDVNYGSCLEVLTNVSMLRAVD